MRSRSEAGLERALSQLRAAYPQAAVAYMAPNRVDLDPALALSGERGVAVELLSHNDAALPLRTDWRNEHDPLSGVIAAVTPVEGERIVYRLALGPAPHGAADGVRRRIAPDRRRGTDDRRQAAPSALPLVAALAIVAAGLQGWRWYEAGEWLRLGGAGTASLIGVPLVGAPSLVGATLLNLIGLLVEEQVVENGTRGRPAAGCPADKRG